MEIKQNSGPKINKEEKTGLAGILGALGWNAAAGEAASGGLGGVIDAVTSSGILATKAGLVSLVLAGSTIASGVGWLGYKVLGPGPADRAHAQFQVFKARPPQTASSQGSQNGNASGSGASSLSGLSQANQGAMGGEGQNQSASVSAPAVAAIGAAPVVPNAGQAFGGGAGSMPKLAGGKIGQLSNLNAAAGGAPPASKAAMPAHVLAANVSPGVSGASPRAATAGRGLTGSSGGSGAGSNMSGAGTGYQGLGPNNLPGTRLFDAGGSGLSVPGGAGMGGLGGGAPSAFPNAASYGGGYSPQGTTPPPGSNGTNVTPWQGAINLAILLSAAAAALLALGYKLGTASDADFTGATKTALIVIGGLVALIGGFIAYLGSKIAGGAYGQSFQGGAFILSGTFTTIAGVALATHAGQSDTNAAFKSSNLLWMACGAAGLAGAMVGYITPGQSYPASMWYGNPPDWTNQNAQVNPNPMLNGTGTNYP